MSEQITPNTSLSPRRLTRREFVKLGLAGLLSACRSSQRPTVTPVPALTAAATPASEPTATPIVTITAAAALIATPAAKEARINLSDIIFTNPHYNFLDTGIYDDYGPDMVGWGFLPAAQGSTDTSNYVKAVERHQNAGIRFQARIEWDVVWDGMKNFKPDYENAACRDFDGNTLSFPWNPSAFWFCSHQPLFRDYVLYQINMALAASPDSLMFDSQTSTPITYWHGGCFCDRCMAEFSDWLNNNYEADELSSIGIFDVAAFDYHDYLVAKGYTKEKYNDAVKRWLNNIPLSQEYRLFQLQFINAYVQELARYARDQVDYDLMISTSSPIVDPFLHGSRMVYVPEIDFYTAETNHNADRKSVSENAITHYKVADALGRPLVLTGLPNPDWLTMYREKRVNLARSWIAQAYAHGAIFMVPIKMWAYEGAKHYWYKSRSGDYDFVYRFIGENADLFDGYAPVSHLGLLYVHTAYRNNSKVIFDACAALTRENIPFRLVIAGDDWWPIYLDRKELESLDVVVTTADAKYLDPAQQVVLDAMSDRVMRWSDMTHLFDRFPREITVDASNVIVLPRARPDEPSAPSICHLINRNYRKEDDTMDPQRDFTVTLAKPLFGRTFSTAKMHVPGRESLILACEDTGDATGITVPELDLWAVLELA